MTTTTTTTKPTPAEDAEKLSENAEKLRSFVALASRNLRLAADFIEHAAAGRMGKSEFASETSKLVSAAQSAISQVQSLLPEPAK